MTLPSTLGGQGWIPRELNHSQELHRGRIWAPCRSCSEVEPLQSVLLLWPSEAVVVDNPAQNLMYDQVDLTKLTLQASSLANFFGSRGIGVRLLNPKSSPPPNLIFMRDLFMMTPGGAVLGRMAAKQRAGEERFAAQALADAGVPIIATVHGTGTFEGADALWLTPSKVLFGLGVRSNSEGMRQVGRALEDFAAELIPIKMPEGVQHLLGIVNLIDHDLAAVHAGKASRELLDTLEAHNIETIPLEPGKELDQNRSMNFVTLRPRELVMPAGSPLTRAIFEKSGVTVHELDVSEYLKAAGGLGCLTGVLWREEIKPCSCCQV